MPYPACFDSLGAAPRSAKTSAQPTTQFYATLHWKSTRALRTNQWFFDLNSCCLLPSDSLLNHVVDSFVLLLGRSGRTRVEPNSRETSPLKDVHPSNVGLAPYNRMKPDISSTKQPYQSHPPRSTRVILEYHQSSLLADPDDPPTSIVTRVYTVPRLTIADNGHS